MDIVKVTPYEDRGLLRKRIEWVDGKVRGVADTHCAITGVSLGANYTLCVRHCRWMGHYSREVNHIIMQYTKGEISEQDMLAFFNLKNRYPYNQKTP